MTTYKLIFDEFKDKITSYKLLELPEDIQEDILESLLRKAVSRFDRVYTVNDTKDGFVEDLTYTEIDIITEWMIHFWILPYLNNEDNLRNILNTADYNMYSPANLIKEIGTLCEDRRKRARSLSNEFRILHSDIDTWRS